MSVSTPMRSGAWACAALANTTVVNMVGTKVAPKSSANVYWDSTSTNVYLVVKNMPKLPTDMSAAAVKKRQQISATAKAKPKPAETAASKTRATAKKR